MVTKRIPLQKAINSTPATDQTECSPRNVTPKPVQPVPFIRSGFPNPLSKPSLLPSLSPNGKILTCFRMADILRAASLSGVSFLEIYATVTSSHRRHEEQYFTFSDLFFPSQALQIIGCYVGWRGVDLFEADTLPFLKASLATGILCRAICVPLKGTRRQGTELRGSISNGLSTCAGLKLRVLNIWKASWDDVEYAKGLVL